MPRAKVPIAFVLTSRIAKSLTFSNSHEFSRCLLYRRSVYSTLRPIRADSSISYRPESPAPPFSCSFQAISSILIEFHQLSSIIITRKNAAASIIHQSAVTQLSDTMGHRSEGSHGNRAIAIYGRYHDPHISYQWLQPSTPPASIPVFQSCLNRSR